MKVEMTEEGLLVILPENGCEAFALNEWHQKTVGLQSRFMRAIINGEDSQVATLVFANTEDNIAVLEDLEPEDNDGGE